MTADDLRMLRQTAREALGELSSSAQVRRQMADGWDAEVWRRLCGELGVAGLAVPEEYGGAGLSAVEQGVFFEEAGRRMLCGPLLSTAGLAIPLLLLTDDDPARKRYLPGLCAGTLTATVVTSDSTGRPILSGRPIEARAEDGGYVLDGVADHVVDGATADLVFVPALLDGAMALFTVEAEEAGFVRQPLVCLDQTRRQARLTFTRVRATVLACREPALALENTLDVARAMLACEQAGGAAECLDVLVDYAKHRVQFGRAIGSFQATKQKAADLLIKVESANSAAIAAAHAAAGLLAGHGLSAPATDGSPLTDVPELAVTAAVAQAYCCDAFVSVAAENIQVHGGIGFTWEHDAHLYLKRAWTSRELLGRPEEHLETLADHLAAAR
ncbi:acyl-CoA/acyl-ACP dehydrogenase [Streptomyces spinoverrucosus]|uniref:acyl-CoA dehydrogenase family protein n=1 Tax=Streptomyces spinoverrucosus TaxID=284043 RepID=UPI0018C3803E|nr:acyl-CoA dehydrogenase family protein [Streptomyces spinoverrucosus]MBG0855792.1 acyl-CoA/acyl-ACP dehydrogenase [Streptomyces spinoverrucosus]